MTNKPEEEVIQRLRTLGSVTINTGAVVIGIIALFTILGEMGIEIGPALAGVGIAGIAIGFGAQSLVKDFLAGLFILLENQYSVGDVVRIADVVGIVEEISLRRTVLRDLDGVVHVIPNGEIKVASNFTKEWSRVNMNISVSYDADLEHVIGTINRVGVELAQDAAWSEKILKAPQVLRVDKFGDSGIEIKLIGDTKPLCQWEIMGELRLRLKKAFDAEGIEIPWPHLKVYFGNLRSSLETLDTAQTKAKIKDVVDKKGT
ncbi:MAG TPA: mechanosensitive ion channel family protein [Dehalococcoidia bacterium]|nr:mechanosensitive ion channel family protein [Dehalococcoidia bacterium]